MDSLAQDVRYAWRMLARNKAATAVLVLALAFGTGANAAIFSVVNAVLLRPLPYPEPDRLMAVWEDATAFGFPRNTPAPANYLDWNKDNRTFADMAAYEDRSLALLADGAPERIQGFAVTANLFEVLGVVPALGRPFAAADDRPGAPEVVILSDGLWRRRFGASPAVLGTSVLLDGRPYAVVGVMPRGFGFPSARAQAWVPVAFTSETAASRGNHYLEVVGRLAAGASPAQATADLETIARRLEREYPETNKGIGALAVPLHEQKVGDIRTSLLVLLGAVGLVLLVACANVANLLLARSVSRQREIAVRAALGAGRGRLVRQMLTESVILGLLGSLAGLLLARVSLRLLVPLVPESVAAPESIALDARVLVFTLGLALFTGFVFGMAPALHLSRTALAGAVREGTRSSEGGGRGRTRGVLVAAEVALSLVLLIGAGLLIKSFDRLRRVDAGFRAERMLTMGVDLPSTAYPDAPRRRAFWDALLLRLPTLPGVESAAVITHLPLTFDGDNWLFLPEGQEDGGDGTLPVAVYRVVSRDYFRTVGIPLRRGRAFEETDRAGMPQVAVVNHKMAETYWPGQDPLGRRIRIGRGERALWLTVVGVVGDTRQTDIHQPPKPELYRAYTQAESGPRDIVVRSAGDPLSLAAAVAREVHALDPNLPVSDVRRMEDVASEAVARPRFQTLLLGVFAGAALLLALVGIYGVIAYSVAQRTREIGIRLALGATRADIVRAVMGPGFRLTLAGLGVGLVGAFATSRLLAGLLFGVSAIDAGVFAAVPALVLAVSLLAAYLPARRGALLDPVRALRWE
jgi:putative ABC transport system permease protein